jgi:hypothetical protein
MLVSIDDPTVYYHIEPPKYIAEAGRGSTNPQAVIVGNRLTVQRI